MWLRKPLNIGITIGAGVLAVVTIVLIIYGVVTHREAGLLQVCWVGGEARYLDGEIEEESHDYGSCEGTKELVWPSKQIPLTVTAIQTSLDTAIVPGSSSREALDSAIRDINSQVGCKLLEPAGLRDGSAILARIGEAVDVSARRNGGGSGKAPSKAGGAALGFARHHKVDGGGLHCDMSVSSSAGSLRGEYLVTHHELLHCVGLAHDFGNPASAMYPLTADDTMLDRMHAARITDADRARLRELYCP